jgi:hypothetical protein
MNQPSRHQRKLQKNLAYRGACVYDPRRKFPRITPQEREEVIKAAEAWLHKYMAIPPITTSTTKV